LKLIALLLALAAPAFADVNACFITDPTTQSTRAKVNPSSGGALQVYCVGGTCTGGGASSGGGGDGGYTVVIQGPGGDGGIAWGVTGTVTVSNFPASQPVTGPISVNITDAGSPLNVQGTLTCSGPMTDTQFRAAPLPGPLSVNITDAGSPLNVQGAVTVSGTVTTTPPSNASTNVAQFGGTNVSTGTGASGAGIPRVTISNDSSLAANQSVNIAQVSGVNTQVGSGASGTGTIRVMLSSDSQLNANQSVNVAQLAGTTTATVAVGVQKVGIVGNTNAAIDAANNGTAPANVLVGGWQLQSGATATAGTAGQVGSPVASLDHVPYARLGGPVVWNCSLDNIGATLTQCQAVGGAGLKYYITDIEIESTTATAGLFLVRYGTGTNCGTGTTSLFPGAATVPRFSYPANTAANPSVFHFLSPIPTAAAQEICIICTATNTCTVHMTGYTAP
jgi:hypothetical protein